jgi:predicted DNA-binding transcriptional regulator AlpA
MIQTEIQKRIPDMRTEIRDEVIEELKEYITEHPISEEEACKILGCSHSAISKYRTRADNPLPYLKGRPCKYMRSEVKKWLQSNKGIYSQPK